MWELEGREVSGPRILHRTAAALWVRRSQRGVATALTACCWCDLLLLLLLLLLLTCVSRGFRCQPASQLQLAANTMAATELAEQSSKAARPTKVPVWHHSQVQPCWPGANPSGTGGGGMACAFSYCTSAPSLGCQGTHSTSFVHGMAAQIRSGVWRLSQSPQLPEATTATISATRPVCSALQCSAACMAYCQGTAWLWIDPSPGGATNGNIRA